MGGLNDATPRCGARLDLLVLNAGIGSGKPADVWMTNQARAAAAAAAAAAPRGSPSNYPLPALRPGASRWGRTSARATPNVRLGRWAPFSSPSCSRRCSSRHRRRGSDPRPSATLRWTSLRLPAPAAAGGLRLRRLRHALALDLRPGPRLQGAALHAAPAHRDGLPRVLRRHHAPDAARHPNHGRGQVCRRRVRPAALGARPRRAPPPRAAAARHRRRRRAHARSHAVPLRRIRTTPTTASRNGPRARRTAPRRCFRRCGRSACT